jgi:hypothetical protein
MRQALQVIDLQDTKQPSIVLRTRGSGVRRAAPQAPRRTLPRSGDGPERSEGFAAEGREQSLRARQHPQRVSSTRRVQIRGALEVIRTRIRAPTRYGGCPSVPQQSEAPPPDSLAMQTTVASGNFGYPRSWNQSSAYIATKPLEGRATLQEKFPFLRLQ